MVRVVGGSIGTQIMMVMELVHGMMIMVIIVLVKEFQMDGFQIVVTQNPIALQMIPMSVAFAVEKVFLRDAVIAMEMFMIVMVFVVVEILAVILVRRIILIV